MQAINSSIDKAAAKVSELDAAGWGLIILCADAEADIRRVVAKYPHLHESQFKTKDVCYDNVKESIGNGLVKNFFSPLEYPPVIKAGENNPLREWLSAGLRNKSVGMRHRVMYIPNLDDLIGHDDERKDRSVEQTAYLYLIRAVCEEKKKGYSHTLIVAGSKDGVVSRELLECAYIVNIDYPEPVEIDAIIRSTCDDCGGRYHGLEPASATELTEILRGMRQDEIRSVINLAFAQHEHPLANGAKELFDAARKVKQQCISNVRGLRWISTNGMAQIGGLAEAKEWLQTRSAAFNYTHAARKFAVTAPKGVLLAGLPGCGKTLFAKVASQLLSKGQSNKIPVLQMDLNAMLGKYVGDTEANFAYALRKIEGVAPCVVIVDEIEKFFGGISDGNGNSEASRHIFASMLEWMQEERDKPILVIATANKVDKLPPELKRKGRFDETFFVGIPTCRASHDIMYIHLRRKSQILDCGFDYESVIKATLHAAAKKRMFFNGADIESIINAAFCTLFARIGIEAIEDVQGGASLDESLKYSTEDVISALSDELERTRSYFDSNMDETAAYWVLMRRLNFRNAGGEDLFSGIPYKDYLGEFEFENIEQDGGFKFDDANHGRLYLECINRRISQSAEAGDYDAAFRYSLAASIFRYVQEKCNER